jgi:hypothetical protein
MVPATRKKNHKKSCISGETSPKSPSLSVSKRIEKKIQKRSVKIILVLFIPFTGSQRYSLKKETVRTHR